MGRKDLVAGATGKKKREREREKSLGSSRRKGGVCDCGHMARDCCANPTNVAGVHLATGCPSARAGVERAKKKRKKPLAQPIEQPGF